MAHTLRLIHVPGEYVAVEERGRPLLTYHYGPDVRYPYCHPVNLPGGPSVTLSRPFDHDWHLGLYFAWKYLDGHNVWEGPDSGEPWGCSRHLAIEVPLPNARGAAWTHTVEWVTADGAPLMRDTRRIVVRPPDAADRYVVDWALTFVSLRGDLTLERRVEWGGYAGLSARLPRSFAQLSVRNADGQRDPAATHAARSRWTDYSGWVDGYGKTWGGLAMVDHPSNPRFPTPWLTYHSPELQFLNAAFLRDEPFVLRRDAPLRLAYRVVAHWGEGDPARLEAEARGFAAIDPFAL